MKCIVLFENHGFGESSCQDSCKLENLNAVPEIEDESDVLIECKDVYKSFGEKHILKGVNFKVDYGYCVNEFA